MDVLPFSRFTVLFIPGNSKGECLQDHLSSDSYYHTNSIAMLYLVHK